MVLKFIGQSAHEAAAAAFDASGPLVIVAARDVADTVEFLQSLGRMRADGTCDSCGSETCPLAIASSCTGWGARRLLARYADEVTEKKNARR